MRPDLKGHLPILETDKILIRCNQQVARLLITGYPVYYPIRFHKLATMHQTPSAGALQPNQEVFHLNGNADVPGLSCINNGQPSCSTLKGKMKKGNHLRRGNF